MKYKQLPERPRSGVVLKCKCGAEYSACRGDYFRCLDDVPVCDHELCGEKLYLARRVVRYVRITPDEAGIT